MLLAIRYGSVKMCARFTLATTEAELAELFDLPDVPPTPMRYNIAPTEEVLAAVPAAGTLDLRPLRWGLVPSWAHDPSIGQRLINARAEGVDSKPAFRQAFRQRRCLVPATGFYEWREVPAEEEQLALFEGVSEIGAKARPRKVPYLFSLEDGTPFAFAGLWERWESPHGHILESVAILTTEPNDLLAQYHDRMPVIFEREDQFLWTDPEEGPPERLLPLLRPFPAERMRCHPVSGKMSNPRYKDPDCIQPSGAAGAGWGG
jgi:putative SOS response-associated peptidase YedK